MGEMTLSLLLGMRRFGIDRVKRIEGGICKVAVAGGALSLSGCTCPSAEVASASVDGRERGLAEDG